MLLLGWAVVLATLVMWNPRAVRVCCVRRASPAREVAFSTCTGPPGGATAAVGGAGAGEVRWAGGGFSSCPTVRSPDWIGLECPPSARGHF